MTPKRSNSTIRWPVDMGIPFCCGDELAQTGSLEAGGPLVGGLTGGQGRGAISGLGPRSGSRSVPERRIPAVAAAIARGKARARKGELNAPTLAHPPIA